MFCFRIIFENKTVPPLKDNYHNFQRSSLKIIFIIYTVSKEIIKAIQNINKYKSLEMLREMKFYSVN